jgi:glycosyltransferase involved in cell wall biosynthesis
MWRSEPDEGQSQAINKAFALARGDIVGWLNSDDAYFSRDVIEKAVEEFERHPGVIMVYGHAALVDGASRVMHMMWVPPPQRTILTLHNFVVQPSVFLRRNAFGTTLVDERYQYAMDRELWLRIWRRGQVRRLPRVLAVDRHHPQRKSYTRPDLLQHDAELLHVDYGVPLLDWRRRTVLKVLKVLFRWAGGTLIRNASRLGADLGWKVDSVPRLLVRQLAVTRAHIVLRD